MYDTGSSRLAIMIAYAAGTVIIALLTILLVPHQGFVVGDTGQINWKNGAKMKHAGEQPIGMTSMRDDDESGAASSLDNADDAKMLDGQRSDSYDADAASTPPSPPSAHSPAAAPNNDAATFQSLPFAVQARSPRHLLLLLLFGTTIARMAFFFGTFNAQVTRVLLLLSGVSLCSLCHSCCSGSNQLTSRRCPRHFR
jgi:hypothetical protein